MSRSFRIAFNVIIGISWTGALAVGGLRLWKYESTAGAEAHPPLIWPVESRVVRKPSLPALVVLVHPRCPCSRATIDELARLMAQGDGRLTTTVVMIRPAGSPRGWEQTDLWRSAAVIPGVTVMVDEEGQEARRFGAATSGQALLYAANGRLLFAGGITESRGHSGDNAGRAAILDLVLNPSATIGGNALSTPVYGCPLFDESAACRNEGETTCRK